MAFEKISLNQWLTYDHGNINNYNNIMIPKRSTINAAGYDFFIPFKLEMVPGKVYKIGTGIKCDLSKICPVKTEDGEDSDTLYESISFEDCVTWSLNS